MVLYKNMDQNEVHTVSVLDDRLMLSDKINYGVFQGAKDVTVGTFNAISESASQHQYNVLVPSPQTVIDRRVQWQSTVELTVSATTVVAAGNIPIPLTYESASGPMSLVNFGFNDALSPMPLHNLMSTIQAKINNSTVTLNAQDVLPQLLRVNNKGDLMAYNGTTPTAYDSFMDYNAALGFLTNPLGGIENSTDEDINFRGSYPVSVSAMDPPVAQGINPAADTVYTQKITFTVSEPLLLSPFMFGQPENKSGFFGVNNLTLSMNVGSLQRVIRHAIQVSNPASAQFDRNWALSVNSVKFTNSRLVFTFLSPQDTQRLPLRCVTPYYELPRYLLSSSSTGSTGGSINSGATTEIKSNSIVLQSIPDKFIICVRKPIGGQTTSDTDSFMPISGVNITFNNRAGICSGMTTQNLYTTSRENGYNGSWLEFSGQARATINSQNVTGIIYTSGSVLVLELGKDIPLGPAESAGSQGNYTVQFNLTVTNNYSVAVTPEICLVCVNSGAFVIQDGSSVIRQNLLTPEMVLNAKPAEVTQSDIKRMLGGNFFDTLRSVWKIASPIIKAGTNVADNLAGSGLTGAGSYGSGLTGAGVRRLKDRLK